MYEYKELYKKYKVDHEDEKINIKNENAWKRDMFKTYGVLNNPLAQKAYDVAWEYAHTHSAPMERVETLFMIICDVIRDDE